MFYIKYFLRFILVSISKFILTFIPKDDDLILFTSWFGKKYADSSRYMFEYFLYNRKYKVFWMSSDRGLYESLQAQSIPVVFSRSFKGIWYQIRAKMLVSSIQTADYNYLFLRNCVYFDLDHGFALKKAGYSIPGTKKISIAFDKFLRLGMDFRMSASTPFGMEKVLSGYDMKPEKVVHCNKPRTDVLFDKKLQQGKNEIINKIKNGRKAIIWMPTHRSCGEKTIEVSKIVNLSKLQAICESNNIVFIIKKHFYHNKEKENLDQYPNIFDVTSEEIDSQVILAQADALVSDYSASYVEYLILDRPIILYAYDKDDFLKNERELDVPFEKNTAGEIVLTQDSFLDSIKRIASDWYDVCFAEGRHKACKMYFDENAKPGHFREEVGEIIDKLIKHQYTPDW